MTLRKLSALDLCDAIIKNKEEFDDMRISLLENCETKKLKIRVIINEGEENEIKLFSIPYESKTKKELMKLCESVKEAYTNEKNEEDDDLPF